MKIGGGRCFGFPVKLPIELSSVSDVGLSPIGLSDFSSTSLSEFSPVISVILSLDVVSSVKKERSEIKIFLIVTEIRYLIFLLSKKLLQSKRQLQFFR